MSEIPVEMQGLGKIKKMETGLSSDVIVAGLVTS